jgi:hypothetical protein
MANRQRQRLGVVEHPAAAQPLQPRHVVDRGAEPPRAHVVLVWHHPVGRALKDAQPGDPAGDLGDELHGAGPVADDRDPFSAQLVVVIPACGVEAVPGEALQAGQRRNRRLVELAGGDEDHVRPVDLAGLGLHLPFGARLVEAAGGHPCREPDQRGDAVLLGDAGTKGGNRVSDSPQCNRVSDCTLTCSPGEGTMRWPPARRRPRSARASCCRA